MTDAQLAGFGVLVTRPSHQSEPLVTAIEEAGGTSIAFPVIDIVGRSVAEIRQDAAGLARPDVVVFVSRNAVEHGLRAIDRNGISIAAIGPATAAALEAAGRRADIVPASGFDSEHLLQHEAFDDVQGKSVWIVRGESGRGLLADVLASRGAQVGFLPVYRRTKSAPSAATLAALEDAWANGRIDCVTIMSVESLENLLALLPPATRERLRATPLVAPGYRVIQTAEKLIPGAPLVMAPGPRPADMLEALIKLRQSGTD